MKAENTNRAAQLVNLVAKLEAAQRRLLREDASPLVHMKAMTTTAVNRELAEVTIPPTYLAKAIADYCEGVRLEAETMGVVFSQPDGDGQ